MNLVKRRSTRAVLLNEKEEILLMNLQNSEMKWRGWITPGGGIEAGESEEQALRRELSEELGLIKFDIGPHVWYRTHQLQWDGQFIEQTENYFLIRTMKFDPSPLLEPTELEKRSFLGFKWWSTKAMRESSEIFAPASLPRLLEKLIVEGVPATPEKASETA